MNSAPRPTAPRAHSVRSPRRIKTLLVAVTAIALASCASPTAPTSTGPQTTPPAASEQTLTVFAAASLNQAFTEIADAFTDANPGVKVTFSFDGSSTLVDQIQGGAPADIFASADEKNMTRAADAKLISGEPTLFATNVLTLITPAGNPAKITGFDASLDGTKLVICADGVPCGNATRQLAKALNLTLKPVSEETKVTDVRGKVESGEADAGVVYETDAKAAGAKVETLPIEGADQQPNRYPIAVVNSTHNPALAKSFIDFVTSDDGQSVLAAYGFGKP